MKSGPLRRGQKQPSMKQINLGAHFVLGQTLYLLGELASAREHLEQGITFYDPQQYRFLT